MSIVSSRGFPVADPRAGLLDTRYHALASNTIDYWMLPDDSSLTEGDLLRAIEEAPASEEAALQLYLHVPFCAQRCRFCAFSGGNSLEFQQAERFARLLVEQMRDLHRRLPIRGRAIRSVNIGGGSPDLLGPNVRYVLRAVRDLSGCTDETEISVELTLSTCTREFIEELASFEVTKVAFGVQSLDPRVRAYMRQPRSLHHLDRVLGWIDGRIPVVNADLITGLPGQDLCVVLADLHALLADERINCISSYLLTPGAAPALVAAVEEGTIPAPPCPQEQARMRLHSYGSFLRAGGVRRGTNTYVDPRRMSSQVLARLAGNECIGARRYEDFLLGAGPQAISSLPGARIENRVDIEGWCRAIEFGEQPFFLSKCSTAHQRDIALWAFPLRWEGLPQAVFDRARGDGAFSQEQLRTLEERVREGLIQHTAAGYELTILGEVFMGHLVRDLKSEAGRRAVDEYVREGFELAGAIRAGAAEDRNETNNRQLAPHLLHRDEPI